MTENRSAFNHPRTATFEQILLAHLERNKRYPRAARVHHQEGVALVQFQIDRQGHVLSSHILRSAGHDLLDDEVMALLQRAQPLPAPPHTISGAVLDLTVPIEFELR
jgi:protein TonB